MLFTGRLAPFRFYFNAFRRKGDGGQEGMRWRVVRANSRRKRVLPDLLATPLVASSILPLSFEPVAILIEPTDQPRSTCLPKLRVAL